jgi:hypothetical protein|nr:MAG TPA: LAMBDA REPRESSOR (TRIPLE MUTANT)/DNA COMPLEX-DNA COMPLEX, DOUBLE HELIX, TRANSCRIPTION-DNA.1A [Caudoviricetes sp.]
MYNTVKERIAKYLKDSKIPQSVFCERVGLSKGYLGAMRKSFQPDTINNIIIEFPNLNIEWLLTGKGEMLKRTPSTDADILSLAGKNEFLITYLQEKDRKIEELLRENARLQMELESAKNSSTASSNVNSKHVG